MKEQYHHGNLKHDLIENGIQIISKHGSDYLSIRSLSKQCGVSHNAIYRHFESKEKLIDCCRAYVTDSLAKCLQEAIKDMDYTNPDTINKLSYTYIEFFRKHPTYFGFLYGNEALCKIRFTLDEESENYAPFEIFRTVCVALIEQYQLSKEEGLKRLVKYWALMQGAISLMTSPNIEIYGEWTDYFTGIF